MIIPGFLVLVARIRLAVAQAIAQILEDGRAFADLPPRKYAVAVNG